MCERHESIGASVSFAHFVAIVFQSLSPQLEVVLRKTASSMSSTRGLKCTSYSVMLSVAKHLVGQARCFATLSMTSAELLTPACTSADTVY
jgi:hypothetical protein